MFMDYIMHISLVHISSTYNIYRSYTKSHSKLAGGARGPWTTFGGLLPPSPDILGALALHRLLAGLLLCLLSGLLLLLLPGLLLLPFSIDISSKCLVILPSLLKVFLG
jgi:hypothetical protein